MKRPLPSTCVLITFVYYGGFSIFILSLDTHRFNETFAHPLYTCIDLMGAMWDNPRPLVGYGLFLTDNQPRYHSNK